MLIGKPFGKRLTGDIYLLLKFGFGHLNEHALSKKVSDVINLLS